ncbi:MAG: hypothetical protein ACD_18C00108G0001 [uncultured bacterium]|nr:MAG: hypothetical protein ACD_18C00108G0001 [uncultured bacterium]
MDEPTTKKGFLLGVFVIMTGLALDSIITVPLFVKSYGVYFSNVYLFIGLAEVVLLTTYAGYEFDATYTKDTDK